MTKNQWRMLEILDKWGGRGTCEVELQWGDYDFGETEAGEAKGWRTCRLVVAGIVRSLARKGYAVVDAPYPASGYDITEMGRALLARRNAHLTLPTVPPSAGPPATGR